MSNPSFDAPSNFSSTVKKFARVILYQQSSYNEEWRNSLAMIAEFQVGGFGRVNNYYWRGTTMLTSKFIGCINCGFHANLWFDGSTFSGDSYIAFEQGSKIIMKNEDSDAIEGVITKDQFSW